MNAGHSTKVKRMRGAKEVFDFYRKANVVSRIDIILVDS